jgi:hypothetical protein
MWGRGLTGYRDQGMPVQRRRWSTAIVVLVAWMLVASCGGAEAPSTEVGSTDIAVTTTGASTTTVEVTEAAAGSTVEDDGQPDEVVEDDLGVVGVADAADEPVDGEPNEPTEQAVVDEPVDGEPDEPTVGESGDTSPAADSGGAGVNWFQGASGPVKDCLVRLFGPTLYDELQQRRASPDEDDLAGRCQNPGAVEPQSSGQDLGDGPGGDSGGVGVNWFHGASGPVKDCLVSLLGPTLFDELQNRRASPAEDDLAGRCQIPGAVVPQGSGTGPAPDPDRPGNGPEPSGPDLQDLDTTSPLPISPVGGDVTASLGPVILRTYDPVVITAFERSTVVYVYATNSGSDPVVIQGPRGYEVGMTILSGLVSSPQHFFDFDPYPVTIAPGATEVFEYMTTRGAAVTEMVFPFTLVGTGTTATLTVDVEVAGETPDGPDPDTPRVAMLEALPKTATIRGTVSTLGGMAVTDGEVYAYPLRNMGERLWRTRVEADGSFLLRVPSTEDLRAVLGDRTLPYDLLGYSVDLSHEGYTAGHAEVSQLVRGGTVDVDLSVSPVAARSYDLVGELNTGGIHGQWWVLPQPGFETFVAVQGRHPPDLGLPGHVVSLDAAGNQLWRYETADECWGLDVSVDGSIAAGCHDGTVHLLAADGSARWTFDSGSMNRWVAFSPDGRTLLTGPDGAADVVLLEVASGDRLWSHASDPELGWLRNATWSPDGSRVVVGFGGGKLVMYEADGTEVWRGSTGEFPLVLQMDDRYRVYAAGKNRELVAFEADGSIRYRNQITNHVVSAGSDNMDAAGAHLALGTVSSALLFYRTDGTLLWQRTLPGNTQGHNALDMTPDGSLIVVGTGGEEGIDGWVSVFDSSGGLLWQEQFPDGRDLGTVVATVDFNHSQRGAITVAVSDDGSRIVVGFGDSSIRIFELR